jgi:hypothetical protein
MSILDKGAVKMHKSVVVQRIEVKMLQGKPICDIKRILQNTSAASGGCGDKDASMYELPATVQGRSQPSDVMDRQERRHLRLL